MRYIDSTSIGAVSKVLAKNSGELRGGFGARSLLFGSLGNHSLTMAQRKKIARRRFRMFVDNIIMHHKRLHDRNREITIDLTRKKLLDKEKEKKKKEDDRELKEKNKWREKYAKNSRAVELKERINARRIRAKSSWVAMLEESRAREGNI